MASASLRLIYLNVIFLVVALLSSIVLNILFSNGKLIIADLLFMPLNFSEFIYRPHTLITYMFMHDLDSILHIAFNMLFLYWFGRIIENLIGESKIYAIYLLGGILGAVLALLVYTLNGHSAYLVGASGAVNAIVFAAVLLAPDYEFMLLFLGRIKIKYIAAFKLLTDLMAINAFDNLGGSLCHIGGALMGLYFIYRLKQGKDLSVGINKALSYLSSLVRQKKIKTPKTNPFASKSILNIDQILDKISAHGYDSLSEQEKAFLFQQSKDRTS